MSDNPYISVSRMSSYSRCPEAFRRRYMEGGQRLPPSVAMARGKAVHSGAKANFTQKIESHSDLPVRDIVGIAAAKFGEHMDGDVHFSPGTSPGDRRDEIGDGLDSVVTMAEVHAKQQAPDYQPIIVEHKVTVLLPGSSVNLLGIIDLADDLGRVVDFKTSRKKPPADAADKSIQLTAYAACFHALTGKAPTEQVLECVVESKTRTYRHQVRTHQGVGDYRALAARINATQAAIDAGSFPPTDPTNWWCSDRFCGYHSTCPFVSGGNHAQND